MRIMILDDMQVRHDGFKVILAGNDLFHTMNFSGAQRIMQDQHSKGQPIEMCCLDHDLADGDSEIVDTFKDYTGQTVAFNGEHFAFWLNKQEFCPPQVLIHSWNESGAANMYNRLINNPRIQNLILRPYKPPPGFST